jgi:hypothetical protein
MFNKNGEIYMVKNIWQCCKQIRIHCFSVETYYVVSYDSFFNTDTGNSVAIPTSQYFSFFKKLQLFALAGFDLTTHKFQSPPRHQF